MTKPHRLTIIVTHPIQHFVPFYRGLAQHPNIDLTVVYGAPIGIESYYDEEMQTQIAWKMDMLGGYESIFLEPDQGKTRPSPRSPTSRKGAQTLDALKPDAVLIYGYAQVNALRALRWCRSNKVPAMMIGDSELLQHRSGLKTLTKQIVIPQILKRFSAFLSVGDRNEEYYRQYGVSDSAIFRSPFTIDETAYVEARANRAALRHSVREEYGIAQDDLLALFVGKLSARKRAGDLLDALALLKDKTGRKVSALFAGNGEDMAALSQQIAADALPAHMAGFVNVDRLPALYAAADVLVHPSLADPHPLICSEAACIGLSLLLSDKIGAAGPTDIARAGENAMIFPVGDASEIAAQLARFANDQVLLDKMSLRSIAIFEELDLNRSVGGVIEALTAVRRS